MKTKILYGAGNAAFLFLSWQDKRALKKIAATITDQSTNTTKQIFHDELINNVATISRDKNSARISNEDSIMLINKWLGE